MQCTCDKQEVNEGNMQCTCDKQEVNEGNMARLEHRTWNTIVSLKFDTTSKNVFFVEKFILETPLKKNAVNHS